MQSASRVYGSGHWGAMHTLMMSFCRNLFYMFCFVVSALQRADVRSHLEEFKDFCEVASVAVWGQVHSVGQIRRPPDIRRLFRHPVHAHRVPLLRFHNP
jgi:hypothetical protein